MGSSPCVAEEGVRAFLSKSILFATRIVSGPGQAPPPAAVLAGAGVEHEQPDFGRLGACQRPAQPLLLDRIGAVAQPGGVGEHDRVAGEIDRDLDDVAGRAGDRRGDRRLAPREPVQQARFAGIGRPEDRDRDAVAQPLAAMPIGQMRARSRRRAPRYPPRLAPRSRAADPRRENRSPLRDGPGAAAAARASRDTAPPSSPSSWRKAWRRCASVSAAARSAIASAWVRSSLPFRKARRVNSPGSASRSPSRAQRRHDRGEHGAAAVQVKFGDILAGGAARRRKPQRQPVVERLAGVRVAHPDVPRHARRRQRAGERLSAGPLRAGNADDRDRGAPGAVAGAKIVSRNLAVAARWLRRSAPRWRAQDIAVSSSTARVRAARLSASAAAGPAAASAARPGRRS